MMETIQFLSAPVALGVLLVGIHAYLGLHVLEREVIFVDIGLSQVAALGGALSLFFVKEENEALLLSCSLGLCLLAALTLSFFRHFEKKISQEVIIGITFAFASGCLILVLDRLPHGAEHMKEALIGNILFVTWTHVFETGLVYAAVGLIHFIYQKQFWACSRRQSNSFVWDFLFYLLFGVVITFSTHHAGVLVVFSILVVPAALASRFVQKTRQRLLGSWAIGIFGLLIAFLMTYWLDLPAGAGIVATLTSIFFVTLIIKIILERAYAKV